MSKMPRSKFKKNLCSQKKKAHLIFNFMFLGFDSTKSTVMKRIVSMFHTAIYNNGNQLIGQISQIKHVPRYLWTSKVSGYQNLTDITKSFLGTS